MTDIPENKNVNVRLPDWLLKALRQKAAPYHARGEKAPNFGALLGQAWEIAESVSGQGIPQKPSETPAVVIEAVVIDSAHKEAYGLLQFVLDHGTSEDIDWITGNLKTFGEAIRSRKRPSKKANKAG